MNSQTTLENKDGQYGIISFSHSVICSQKYIAILLYISQYFILFQCHFVTMPLWATYNKLAFYSFILYRQPNKIRAYLTFHKWLVSVCNMHNDIWMLQTKTSHLWKVSYAIILLGWLILILSSACCDNYPTHFYKWLVLVCNIYYELQIILRIMLKNEIHICIFFHHGWFDHICQ